MKTIFIFNLNFQCTGPQILTFQNIKMKSLKARNKTKSWKPSLYIYFLGQQNIFKFLTLPSPEVNEA